MDLRCYLSHWFGLPARPARPAPTPRHVSHETPLFDWAKFDTRVAPLTSSRIGDTLGSDIDALIAEFDLLAGPLAQGTLTIGGRPVTL